MKPIFSLSKSNKSSEEASAEWSKNVNIVVRLAFTGVIYKENDCYYIAMKDGVIKPKNCPTLVDVYLYIYYQNENFKKKINDLYEENWSTALILEMVTKPEQYREKMEKIHEQVTHELNLLSDRPSVGKNDFAICPRRSGLMALMCIEKDLKCVK